MATLGKLGHIWKNLSPLEKSVLFGKMLHSRNIGSHTLEKLGHIYKNVSHWAKRVTFRNMGHKGGKWVTFGKMGDTWKNESHLEKWVKLGKPS